MKIGIVVIILIVGIFLIIRKNAGTAGRDLMKSLSHVDEFKLSDSAFLVDAIELKWGLTLREVRELIKGKKPLRTYGGRPNFRVQCKEAFGFRASEVNLRTPREDAQVMQVSYELSPPDTDTKTVNPEYWVNAISKSLGRPLKNPTPASYQVDPSRSGSVIYNTNWITGNVRVTLSTYGGYRENEVGSISIAGLFIDWENEIQFAKSHLGNVEVIENSLVISNAEKYASDIVNIEREQKPYYIADYHLKDPHAAARNRELRRAQRVLQNPNLFDTPVELANMMSERAVLIWKPEGQNDFVFSTKWDSVYFYSDASKNKVSWINVLPAKGSGGMSLSINGLGVSDTHSSEEISKLANKISSCQSKKIECVKDYDC